MWEAGARRGEGTRKRAEGEKETPGAGDLINLAGWGWNRDQALPSPGCHQLWCTTLQVPRTQEPRGLTCHLLWPSRGLPQPEPSRHSCQNQYRKRLQGFSDHDQGPTQHKLKGKAGASAVA